MPMLEPSRAGFTISGSPNRSPTPTKSLSCDSSSYGGVGCQRPATAAWYAIYPSPRRSPSPASRIRDAEIFERALYRAVLAETAVQCDKNAVKMLCEQLLQPQVTRVEGMRIDAAFLQRAQYHGTAFERNFLRRSVRHQYRNFPEVVHVASLQPKKCFLFI